MRFRKTGQCSDTGLTQFLDLMFRDTRHERKMVVLSAAIIAGCPPRTDIAMGDGFGIRLQGRLRDIDRCDRRKARLHESVIRKEVMQAERFRLESAPRAHDVRVIRHAPLNLCHEFRVQT